ncbi:MAG: class I SAM-dependent methyltransferase [Planctomycetota bacterium]
MARGDRPLLADLAAPASPVVEIGGWAFSGAHDGWAVLPWRVDFRAARAAGVAVRPEVGDLEPASQGCVAVHCQRARDHTWYDLAAAWELLAPEGRLLLVGHNDRGVRSVTRQLVARLEQEGEILVNRSRGRVVAFRRDTVNTLQAPASAVIAVDGLELQAPPGVFAAGHLDPGTAMLLARLDELDMPKRVLDCCCGVGPLGLSALRRWPTARAVLLDADHRAVMAAWENAERCGLDSRCDASWWESSEPVSYVDPFDLVLINPPAHRGGAVDVGAGLAAVQASAAALAPGGSLMLVANRRLPYEAALAALGTVERLEEQAGYKVLRMERAAGS